MQATIQKWGNSQGIRIPKHLLESAGIAADETVEISVEEEKIVITKITTVKRRKIEQIFAGYEGGYESCEIDWGAPVGKEIW
ncbi:MAG: AbrB/MazE/SpoVT family DNA-binding domain-containing protein [Cloacibacillus sp.]